MPSNIVESASKGDAISAPLDADLRNAGSVRTPFQSVGNRLKFLENWYDAFVGALTFAANAVWTIAAGKTWTINGSGIFNLASVAQIVFGGNTSGPLVAGGYTGRVPRKVAVITPAAGTTTVDPTLRDTIYADATADCTIQATASPSVPYEAGDSFVVFNQTIYAITVKDPTGVTHGGPLAANEYIRLTYTGSIWRAGEFKIA